MSEKTTEQFINRLKKIHGDKYDYSKDEYAGSRMNITIICTKCHRSWLCDNDIRSLPLSVRTCC